MIPVYPNIIPWFLMCLFAPAQLVLTIFLWSPPQLGAPLFTQFPQPEVRGGFPPHSLNSLGHQGLVMSPDHFGTLFPLSYLCNPSLCSGPHHLFLGLLGYCNNLPTSDKVILKFLIASHCLQNKFLSSCVSLGKTVCFVGSL